MSLRARLLLGLIALTAAGLITAGVITYAAERSFLVSRVDQIFAGNAASSFEDYFDQQLGLSKPGGGPGGAGGNGGGQLFGPPGGNPAPGGGPFGVVLRPPVGTYGIYISASGRRESREFGGQGASLPKLTAQIPLTTDVKHPKLVTVDSVAGAGLQYRVLRKPSDTGSGTITIAVPLRDVSQTLTRLRNIELIVIAAVLLGLAAFAWLLIRLGLRPLDRMGATAGAIAAGDLSRRVSPANPRTEVGRLGLALNAMLGQIEQAFAERQASEDRLRRFLSDASHELRTPLTSIRGYAELYRMGAASDPQETARSMARIEEEAARMGVLVEDLLALARLDEMPQTRREPVDLEPLVRDAAADARAAAPDREVTVAVAGDHVAAGDASQLRQVLANLMRNALTHTPAGSPIELSVEDSDGYVRVVVRDHGPGLPQGESANVFERFWRAEGGRERGKAGAGLGLAIVAAIVDAHEGRVSAANAAGGGAAFAFEIPAA
ncbi:MAG TPA: HAMP domain-containing sensor histidine kinase [Solirubrobacteraceae bacterium]|nr:HAMP domain-containing sensor histidine kinase [Solirubrobacteraceae bacterium]